MSGDLWKCPICGKVFMDEDIKQWDEPLEAWGHIVYEHWDLCPECSEPVQPYSGDIEPEIYPNEEDFWDEDRWWEDDE